MKIIRHHRLHARGVSTSAYNQTDVFHAYLSTIPRLLQGVLILAVISMFSAITNAQPLKADVVTLEGQLVCSLCWFEADRKTTPYGTEEEIKCAIDCAEKGVPSALAVKEGGDYKLYIIENGALKRTPVEWKDSFGKQLRITGKIRQQQDKLYIAADRFEVTGSSEISKAQAAVIGTQAELLLKDLFGVDQKLSSYRGRIVILNFWATWCVPCRTELPELVAIQNDYAALSVQVVGASADAFTDRDKVLKFIRETKLNFPIWLGLSTDEMKRFGVGPALPATLIINRDGKIDTVFSSVIKRADLERRIEAMLKSDAVIAKRIAGASRRPDVSLVPS